MDETRLVLNLLALEKKCWNASRDNPEMEGVANTLVGLIIEVMDFPRDLTEDETDDIYSYFDCDYDLGGMLCWLHGCRAELRCDRELEHYHLPESPAPDDVQGGTRNRKGKR